MPELVTPSIINYSLIWQRLSRLGVSLIPLNPRAKAPFERGWSTANTYDWETLSNILKPDSNVGIRTGYPSHLINNSYLTTIDLDISDPSKLSEAYEKLKTLIPEYTNAIEIKSGSSVGLSRHFILTTDKPIASCVLEQSPSNIQLLTQDGTLKTKSSWQIELFGNNKQHVAPGSIHPDGNQYEIINPTLFEAFLGQVQRKERAAAFISNERLSSLVFDNNLLSEETDTAPVEEKSVEELKNILSRLPPNYAINYDTWLTACLALHYQSSKSGLGLDIGYQIFNKWSATGGSSYDEASCQRTWNAIRNNPKRKIISLGTLVKAGNDYRDGLAYAKALGLGDIPEADKAWIALLERVPVKNQRQGPPLVKETMKNVSSILLNDKRFKNFIYYNTQSNRIVFRRNLEPLVSNMRPIIVKDLINGDEITDQAIQNLLAFFQSGKDDSAWYMPKLSINVLAMAIDHAAQFNQFHPIQEYIKSHTWDNNLRLDNCFVNYLGCENNAYTRDISRKFLIGAVARVFEPGCKFDMTLIIEGPQGVGKSTFVETLAVNPKWFATTVYVGGLGGSKIVENIQAKWFVELSEMTGMRSADITELKHFLSNTTDRMRVPYGRYSQDFPRQNVFIGTTNEHDYLHDKTGNRRFHPIEAKSIDLSNLKEQLPQIWAEAYQGYLSMRAKVPMGIPLPLYIEEGSEALSIVENMREDRMEEAPGDGLLDKVISYLDKRDAKSGSFLRNMVSCPQIWVEGLGRDLEDFGKGPGKSLVNVMKDVKHWRSMGRQRSKNGGLIRLWCRINQEIYMGRDYTWLGLTQTEELSKRAGDVGL